MSALISFLLAAQAVASPGADRPVLDAFRAACERTGDLEAMKADAAASGWTPMADDGEPRVEKLIRMGKEAVEEGTLSGAAFRRALDGRDLFLILSRYEDPSGYWGVGCRLYDFDAAAAVDGAVLASWMGREPTGTIEVEPGIGRRLWEPGWREGVNIEVTHVPPGHALAQTFGLSGNVLVAQAIGGF